MSGVASSCCAQFVVDTQRQSRRARSSGQADAGLPTLRPRHGVCSTALCGFLTGVCRLGDRACVLKRKSFRARASSAASSRTQRSGTPRKQKVSVRCSLKSRPDQCHASAHRCSSAWPQVLAFHAHGVRGLVLKLAGFAADCSNDRFGWQQWLDIIIQLKVSVVVGVAPQRVLWPAPPAIRFE